MGNKKGEIKKSRNIFRVKGGMIICGLASFFTFSESRKPETAQFLIVNMGANNGCSFKLLTPCRFRTSSSSNELKYEFQPTPSINAPYCSSADTGSPVYCNNKAEYKTSIKQTEREGRVEANRRAELTLIFFAESARIYTERE